MFGVLRTVARPWRWMRRVRALKDTVVTHLRQVLDLQREVQTEVRELHRSALLASIHTIEELQSTREELAQECLRLERRLRALERHLGATDNAPPGTPPAAPSEAPA
jgi:hypothetical protein